MVICGIFTSTSDPILRNRSTFLPLILLVVSFELVHDLLTLVSLFSRLWLLLYDDAAGVGAQDKVQLLTQVN